MATHHLPVVDEPASSLHADGRRNYVHPADVAGRFTTRRYVIFAVLIAVYLALPFIKVGGRPAVFLDIVHRRFHIFGTTFNASDFWMMFFVLTGVGFALIFATTVGGRVWCGYACPQTVFLEGIFRRIERLIEGPRNIRLRRNAAPMSFDKLWRKTLKNGIYLAICFGLAHVFLSYFVSLPSLVAMVQTSPAEHLEAFAWVVGFTAVTFFDFAWFREQVCLIICPYGRLQSAMTDRDTVVIGYDTKRGEPRGKLGTEGAGDCIDCKRCVQVCPTGIDIRNGLQLDCIGCSACVDACDEVMTKVGKPEGLIRYDSQNGFEGKPKRVLRPRVYLYTVLGLIGLAVASYAFTHRVAFEAYVLRPGGTLFITTDEEVLDPARLEVVNKRDEPIRLTVENLSDDVIRTDPPVTDLTLAGGEVRYINTVFRVKRDEMRPGLRARLRFRLVGSDEEVTAELPVLGPVASPGGLPR